MTLRSEGLVWYMHGSRMTGESVADVLGVRQWKVFSCSLSVHSSVPGRDFYDSSLPKGIYVCIGQAYTSEQKKMCLDSQRGLRALRASKATSKLVWECRQAICALSNWNKVTLFCVPPLLWDSN